jgi:carbonic anhydrase
MPAPSSSWPLALALLACAAACHVSRAAEPPAALAAARDPMNVLRERLAQKLGARQVPEAEGPNLLRVATKESAPVEGRPAPPPNVKHATVRKPPPVVEPPRASHWAYTGSGGPEAWGRMKPEFAKCANGTRQSPIDIRDGIRVELDPVRFDYQPSAFRVVDTGHTVQVNLAAGNAIEAMGRRYELLQFHFHRPAEERVDGKPFDMVVHLVHKDPEGRLAVVAVLLERGSAHAVVQSVWNNLPLEQGEELAARARLDLNELLPRERRYYTYMGSLTTPPCSEGVLWMVMQQPVQVSAEQIGIFARLYPMNARPIQSAGGRLIKQSD